jgi:hypothetical protein
MKAEIDGRVDLRFGETVSSPLYFVNYMLLRPFQIFNGTPPGGCAVGNEGSREAAARGGKAAGICRREAAGEYGRDTAGKTQAGAGHGGHFQEFSPVGSGCHFGWLIYAASSNLPDRGQGNFY